MPYRTNADLPASVRDHLPAHAQDIYRAAFNHAFAAHAGDIRQEEIAHRTAWAAVKRSYVKDGDRWVPEWPGWPTEAGLDESWFFHWQGERLFNCQNGQNRRKCMPMSLRFHAYYMEWAKHRSTARFDTS